jgi:hypothetical protein
MGTVTADDARLLEFEEAHPRNDGRKEELARAQFGYSKACYFQKLIQVCRPLLVKRLRRRQRADELRRAQRRIE